MGDPNRYARRGVQEDMTRRPSPSLGAALVRSVATAALVGLAFGGPALGASAAPSELPGDPDIEAWLDEPFVPDAPAGATIGTGVTMWDRAHETLFEVSEAYVILRPASGRATPSETRARSDWPGHLAFEIAVPKGGPGKLEVGFEGQTCDAGNTCTTTRFAFAFGGIGPPPDAPRSALVVASIHDIAGPVVTGEPIDVVVDVEPRAAWGLDALGLPDHLVVVASERAGVGESKADLPLTDAAGIHGITYSGQITLAEAGNITLLAAFPGHGTRPDDFLVRSVIRVTVEAAGAAGSPGSRSSGAPVAPAAPELSWLWIAVAALVVVGGVVVSKAFADL